MFQSVNKLHHTYCHILQALNTVLIVFVGLTLLFRVVSKTLFTYIFISLAVVHSNSTVII